MPKRQVPHTTARGVPDSGGVCQERISGSGSFSWTRARTGRSKANLSSSSKISFQSSRHVSIPLRNPCAQRFAFGNSSLSSASSQGTKIESAEPSSWAIWFQCRIERLKNSSRPSAPSKGAVSSPPHTSGRYSLRGAVAGAQLSAAKNRPFLRDSWRLRLENGEGLPRGGRTPRQ